MRLFSPLISLFALVVSAFGVLPAQAAEKDELALTLKQLDHIRGQPRSAPVFRQIRTITPVFILIIPAPPERWRLSGRGLSAIWSLPGPSPRCRLMWRSRCAGLPPGAAMNPSQQAAFEAAAGSGMSPAVLNLLCIGALLAVLFLWAASGTG